MKKIRILHVIKSLGRGGAEMLLPETLKHHDKEKFEFHYIYFLPWKDQMVSAIRESGGTVTCFSANNNIQLMLKVRQVAKYVKDHNIQLIHAHLPWAGILVRMVSRMTGVPAIYTEHNKQERYHIATRKMNLLTMNWLTAVIAVSGDVEASIKKFKPSLKPPVITLLNGVNVDGFAPGLFHGDEVRKQMNIPADAPVIGTIAVFRFQKRLDKWMEQAKRILAVVPDTHFVIVGDGMLKEEVLKKRAELGLTDRIHLPGLQTEVRPYLALFDIYMMSSIFEGLPIALLEAMASECAVVTTDAGGIKEVVRNNVDGLLCSTDELDKLGDLSIELLRDPQKRSALGKQGRQRIVESFSIARMVAGLEVLYTQHARK